MTPRARHDSGGVTFGPLVIAGVLASPALWRALQQHQLPLLVALERLLVIAVVCVVVGDAVRRYLDVVPAPQAVPDAASAERSTASAPTPRQPADSPSISPLDSGLDTPTPSEQTAAWNAGDLDGDDLFALDPLPGEDPHLAIE